MYTAHVYLLAALLTVVPVAADGAADRELLLIRTGRRRILPGSKGSSTPKVHCVGSWGAWGTCASNSQQSRTYTVSTYASGGGNACPYSNGATQSQACTQNINCVGAYGPWGACTANAQRERKYKVSVEASGSGNDCPAVDGHAETEACVYVAPNVTVAWQYVSQPGWLNVTEMPLTTCSIGEKVGLRWTSSVGLSMKHDVYQLYSEAAWSTCSFASPAVERHSADSSGAYDFVCAQAGTHFFSCSVSSACAVGKQKLRIHVTDPSQTQSLRAANKPTFATYMEKVIPLYHYGRTISESVANTLTSELYEILSTSPASCADWLPAGENNNATCVAMVYTDLGYISRQRASPDYPGAFQLYNLALAAKPSFCLAESYLVELKIQEGRGKLVVDEQFHTACSACGSARLDMDIVRNKYEAKSWSLPSSSACSPSSSPSPAPDHAVAENSSRRRGGSSEHMFAFAGVFLVYLWLWRN